MELLAVIGLIAAISGSVVVTAIIWLIVGGLICGLLWWLISFVGLPEPINKFARVFVAILAVIICINALLSLVGKPFIQF